MTKTHPHLSSEDLAERLGISIRSVERMRQNGTGPRWLRAGARRVAFPLHEVELWEAERTHTSRAAEMAAQGR
jgi:predicted DNA-binding transcriptional regulator AlpA